MNRQHQIESKLQGALHISQLLITNESHLHNVPPGSESHFKVVLVSPDFEDKMPVKRHQMIYKILADELSGHIHALALHTYTPSEWLERHGKAPSSPDCKGGSKHDTLIY